MNNITIGIPYFNRPELLARLLNRLNILYISENVEFIVFIYDDGSTLKPNWDEFRDVGFEVRIFSSSENEGIGLARHNLVRFMREFAGYERNYYAFFDDDFLPKTGYFENIIKVLESNSKIKMASGYCPELMPRGGR